MTRNRRRRTRPHCEKLIVGRERDSSDILKVNTKEPSSYSHMKNDDFWKSQFAKHDTVSSTGNPPITPTSPSPQLNPVSVGTKTVSTTEEPSTSRMEKTLQPVRSTQSMPGFEEPTPLVLSRFPAKTKTQWEQWLLNRKAVLDKK